MEIIKQFLKKNGEIVEIYKFDYFFTENDFNEIIALIEQFNIKISGIRISNSLEQPEHFFRTFNSVNDFRKFSKEDYFIDDFGVQCVYNNVTFLLSFDFSKEELVTFKQGNINLNSLIEGLENLTKKKVKGM